MRALLATILLLSAGSAFAQQPGQACGPYDKMAEHLSREFNESPIALGMIDEQHLLQVWVSEEGTFTIAVVTPNKVACLLSSGENWQNTPVEPGEPL